ncbi:MAG: UvrD-helicase domain-containing protein [Helicobacteraceae bacterium]|nr:UvrD-helicase domain-containing protein [Helicobacteraceae bacterium]
MDYLSELNEAQQEAATTIDGPILILAGAGTGKTKTITSRLAYLLSLGFDPRSTLTLTFTNKAAKEMRERALGMLGSNVLYPPELYTFHKFGLVFLRFHITALDRSPTFVIIDTDDRKKILKELCGKEMDFKTAASAISHNKNSIIMPDEALCQCGGFDERSRRLYEKLADIYLRYERYTKANNLVDFDDLLLLPYMIMRDNEALRQSISDRYQFLMVDEYQDTNELQFQLLKQLSSRHNNLCVVGDDDQSIYGWRGANVQNILGFAEHFSNVKIIKLEMNYRSTQEILNAANELISHNRSRHEKRLIGTLGSGEAVGMLYSRDENEESRRIATEIKRLIANGASLRQIAVLFRINALSRALEEAFVRESVPFRLIDSVGFYERLEIKDAIAYFRLIINPHDDFSLRRAITKPKRGIGEKAIDKLQTAANAREISIFSLIERSSDDELEEMLSKKGSKAIREFQLVIEELNAQSALNSGQLIDQFEKLIGLKRYYKDKDEGERVQNLDELYGLIRDFASQNNDAGLIEFLSESALMSDQDSIGSEAINLMTIHASKGLEFDHVFAVGLEEGFFPLTGDSSDIEEERRLGYVAFTRAKRTLTLCSAESRFFHGRREQMRKSRFLAEAGLEKGSLVLSECGSFKKGDLVKHRLFGMGRVTAANKNGREYMLTISFGGTPRNILSNYVERV